MFRQHRQSRQHPLMAVTPDDLKRIGVTAFGGESIYPPGYNAVREELEGCLLAFREVTGYAAAGSAQAVPFESGFLDELSGKAQTAGGWGDIGAMLLLYEILPNSYQQDQRYLAIVERGVETLRRDGVAYTRVPPFALDLWVSVHGCKYDDNRPKGWPPTLARLPAPPVDGTSRLTDISVGESRPLAQPPSAPQNMIHGERRAAELIQAVVEGIEPNGGRTQRWDLEEIRAPDYRGFLVLLGAWIGTRNESWVHDDLIPYIPYRIRTRAELRAEALKMSTS